MICCHNLAKNKNCQQITEKRSQDKEEHVAKQNSSARPANGFTAVNKSVQVVHISAYVNAYHYYYYT